VFQSRAELTIDGKGRLSMPARHREILFAQCQGRITFVRHYHGCLVIYPRPVWEEKRAVLFDFTGHDKMDLVRFITGHAWDTEVDGAGRALIPPSLREWAGLSREADLLGVGRYMELWDRSRYATREREGARFIEGAPANVNDFNY